MTEKVAVYPSATTSMHSGSMSLSMTDPSLSMDVMLAARLHQTAAMYNVMVNVNLATGGHVLLSPAYSCCPVLQGENGQIVPLYQFVEVLDSLVDYDHLKDEFPFLSFTQINGAILFLRKLAQFNIKGVDLDEIEDSDLENDEAFIQEIKQALADQEISRVLNANE